MGFRLDDFSELPPAYIEIGELEIFREECLACTQRLVAAGVSTELQIDPGAPHGFDALAPLSAVWRRVWALRSASEFWPISESRGSLPAGPIPFPRSRTG